jgi:hypothetical protein
MSPLEGFGARIARRDAYGLAPTPVAAHIASLSRRWGRGVGVEFADLARPDRDQIERFVARLLAGGATPRM